MKFLTWKEKLGRSECPFLERWVINFGLFSIRLHHWLLSDDDRNFHDHPWWFITFVISGGYYDVTNYGYERMHRGKICYRPALHKHTVEVDSSGCWTLMITGSVVRKWGFWINNKFKKANKYFLEHGYHPCK